MPSERVVEIFGEGSTDVGPLSTQPVEPRHGVVVILTHKLCGEPFAMRVKPQHFAHLRGRGLWQKVRFAKRQAVYNAGTAGVVFVVDTEGDEKRIAELRRGRDHEFLDFPMAVGAAHPCIETWLLSDASAIRRAVGLNHQPQLPEQPEQLPAPLKDRRYNPKTELARVCGATAAAARKDSIAFELRNLPLIRERCPIGFEPFAAEIELRIKPLFDQTDA
jgi:hypothetical protein